MTKKIIFSMCCIVMGLTGCAETAVLVNYMVSPLIPEKVEVAQHDLTGKKILVWVDVSTVSKKFPSAKRLLTKHITEALLLHTEPKAIVDYESIRSYRISNPDYITETIESLGNHFKCDEVLYVLVESLDVDHVAGKGYYQPIMSGYLKIIDVKSGKRLWPEVSLFKGYSERGYVSVGHNNHYEKKLLSGLFNQFATKITRYFYDYLPEKG